MEGNKEEGKKEGMMEGRKEEGQKGRRMIERKKKQRKKITGMQKILHAETFNLSENGS